MLCLSWPVALRSACKVSAYGACNQQLSSPLPPRKRPHVGVAHRPLDPVLLEEGKAPSPETTPCGFTARTLPVLYYLGSSLWGWCGWSFREFPFFLVLLRCLFLRLMLSFLSFHVSLFPPIFSCAREDICNVPIRTKLAFRKAGCSLSKVHVVGVGSCPSYRHVLTHAHGMLARRTSCPGVEKQPQRWQHLAINCKMDPYRITHHTGNSLKYRGGYKDSVTREASHQGGNMEEVSAELRYASCNARHKSYLQKGSRT